MLWSCDRATPYLIPGPCSGLFKDRHLLLLSDPMTDNSQEKMGKGGKIKRARVMHC